MFLLFVEYLKALVFDVKRGFPYLLSHMGGVKGSCVKKISDKS